MHKQSPEVVGFWSRLTKVKANFLSNLAPAGDLEIWDKTIKVNPTWNYVAYSIQSKGCRILNSSMVIMISWVS